MTEFLSVTDVLRLCQIASLGPIRDLGLLQAAITRPQTTVMGIDAYETTELKAAALLDSLCNNHALVDGNKRLAWFATTIFLDMNGYRAALSDDDAFVLVMEIASGRLQLEEIALRLKAER